MLQNQLEQLDKEISSLNNEYDSLKNKSAELQSQKDFYELEIETKQQIKNELTEKNESSQKKIVEQKQLLDNLVVEKTQCEKQLQEIQNQFEETQIKLKDLN